MVVSVCSLARSSNQQTCLIFHNVLVLMLALSHIKSNIQSLQMQSLDIFGHSHFRTEINIFEDGWRVINSLLIKNPPIDRHQPRHCTKKWNIFYPTKNEHGNIWTMFRPDPLLGWALFVPCCYFSDTTEIGLAAFGNRMKKTSQTKYFSNGTTR